MKISLNAVHMTKKVVRHTDNTGKKLPEEMIERQQRSPFRARVVMQLVTDEMTLIEFTVVVIEKNGGMHAFVVDSFDDCVVFRMGEGLAEAAKAMAIECQKRNVAVSQDGRQLLSVEL